MSDYLNQKQLAERLNMSPRTLEKWRSNGKGPAWLKLGGKVAYHRSDIDAYEAEQRAQYVGSRAPALRPYAGAQPHLGR